jgi:hypothetical protein
MAFVIGYEKYLRRKKMKSKKIGIIVLLSLSVLLVLITACHRNRSIPAQETAAPVYLKNNIHVQQHENTGEYRGSYSNWTDPGKGHVVIPVNTLVSKGDFRRGFAIIIQSTQKPIIFELDEKATGMSDDQYWRLITSPEPVVLDRLSQIDRKGIQDGKAYTGMTKEGVRIALGYPAPHKTPSLENNTWLYWTNRFKSIAIGFDGTGKVVTGGATQGSH